MPTGTSELIATPSPDIAYTTTPSPTFTPTFTPTSFPPGFTPSPISIATPICHEGPVEQFEFDLPAPSELRWKTVDNFQSLTGLTGPVHFAYPSPDGRWWVIELVSKRDAAQYEYSSEEALYVLDTTANKHWIASANGKDNFHRFDWLPNGDLLWVDEGQLYKANANGQEKQVIQVAERVIEVWLDKVTGSRALVSGQSALWRLDLSTGVWEKVKGLEDLEKNGEPPISRIQANLRMSNDGSFGALLADHQIWKVPMTFGESARKLGEVDYSDEIWRVGAPLPLVDSPYWYPGRDAYDPHTAGLQQRSSVLINGEDGNLLRLEDIVPPDFGINYFLNLKISPDARWISISNGEGFSLIAIYLLPTNQITNSRAGGRLLEGMYIYDWYPPEIISPYPERVSYPSIAFVIKGDIGSGNASFNQIDLITGETRMVKKLGTGLYPIMRMTWVKNTPIFTEGEIIEHLAEDGTLQPIARIPELHYYEYSKLLVGGAKDQVLFTTAVDKPSDNICRTYYSLYIANLDFVK